MSHTHTFIPVPKNISRFSDDQTNQFELLFVIDEHIIMVQEDRSAKQSRQNEEKYNVTEPLACKRILVNRFSEIVFNSGLFPALQQKVYSKKYIVYRM